MPDSTVTCLRSCAVSGWISSDRTPTGRRSAALAAILVYITLPNKLTIGPNWLVPVLEVLVFVALVLTTPGEEVPGTRMRHRLAVALIGVLAVVNLVALGLLAHYVVEGGAGGRGLVEAAVALWGTIVLVRSRLLGTRSRGATRAGTP
jgi:hypothetical protein